MAYPTVEEVENVIGILSKRWPGRCYEIACAITKAGLVEGRAVYGHYYGPIVPSCPLYHPGSPIHPHGWIILPNGNVCDPTRWVWTDTEPELWVGPANEYDEGGNKWRKAHSSDKPIPSGRNFPEIKLPDHALVLLGLTPDDVATFGHLYWLANLPPDELDPAGPVYDALADASLIGLVPIDNYRQIKGHRT